MADISKININNTEYDIKDATARSGLSGKQDNTVKEYQHTANWSAITWPEKPQAEAI